MADHLETGTGQHEVFLSATTVTLRHDADRTCPHKT
jgi:hypothetical protein